MQLEKIRAYLNQHKKYTTYITYLLLNYTFLQEIRYGFCSSGSFVGKNFFMGTYLLFGLRFENQTVCNIDTVKIIVQRT